MAETCCQFGSDSGINPRPCNWPAAPGGVLPVFNECYSRRDGHRFQRGRDSVVNQPVITLSLSSLATFFFFFPSSSFHFFCLFFFFFQTRFTRAVAAVEIHRRSRIPRSQRKRDLSFFFCTLCSCFLIIFIHLFLGPN